MQLILCNGQFSAFFLARPTSSSRAHIDMQKKSKKSIDRLYQTLFDKITEFLIKPAILRMPIQEGEFQLKETEVQLQWELHYVINRIMDERLPKDVSSHGITEPWLCGLVVNVYMT